MPGTLVMKSADRWYTTDIKFNDGKNFVLPILQKYWNVQEGADRIIQTCGNGIMMVFERLPFEFMDEDTPFYSRHKGSPDPDRDLSSWSNGVEYDHSSNDCLSPITEYMSKMVLARSLGSRGGSGWATPIATSFATKEEALVGVKNKNIYVWGGQNWTYEPLAADSDNNPFKRRGNRWGRS